MHTCTETRQDAHCIQPHTHPSYTHKHVHKNSRAYPRLEHAGTIGSHAQTLAEQPPVCREWLWLHFDFRPFLSLLCLFVSFSCLVLFLLSSVRPLMRCPFLFLLIFALPFTFVLLFFDIGMFLFVMFNRSLHSASRFGLIFPFLNRVTRFLLQTLVLNHGNEVAQTT